MVRAQTLAENGAGGFLLVEKLIDFAAFSEPESVSWSLAAAARTDDDLSAVRERAGAMPSNPWISSSGGGTTCGGGGSTRLIELVVITHQSNRIIVILDPDPEPDTITAHHSCLCSEHLDTVLAYCLHNSEHNA